MSFNDFSMKYFTGARQLDSTGLIYSSDILSRMATMYAPDGSVVPVMPIGWETPAGEYYSTSTDLTKLANYFLSKFANDNFVTEQMLPVFINGDGQSGYGMPWELFYRGGYLVRTKGGAIPGGSSMFIVIPELQFGMTILWNCLNFFNTIPPIDKIIPILIDYIQQQDAIQFPDLPTNFAANFVGSYAPGFVNISVISAFGKQMATLAAGGGVNIRLQPVSLPQSSPLRSTTHFLQNGPQDSILAFQVYQPLNEVPCNVAEGGALFDAWIIFGKFPNGTSGFSTPGIYFDDSFQFIKVH